MEPVVDLEEDDLSEEQRKHRRVRVRQPVWCEGDDLTLFVHARDVSETGLFVRTPGPAGEGRQFRMSFTNTSDVGEEEIIAQVEVVWTRRGSQPGMGLRIVSFEKGQEEFQRFVEAHLAADETSEPS